jgi:hypothetical protein
MDRTFGPQQQILYNDQLICSSVRREMLQPEYAVRQSFSQISLSISIGA